MFDYLLSLNSKLKIILTLGTNGVMYKDSYQEIKQESFKVDAIDTTAAGDTFLGFFLSMISNKTDIQKALLIASKAASISVTRKGAATSIPYLNEVLEGLE